LNRSFFHHYATILKVKAVLVHAKQALSGVTGIALAILDPVYRRRRVANAKPRPLYTREREPVSILQEAW
jgi:hypothetical protein